MKKVIKILVLLIITVNPTAFKIAQWMGANDFQVIGAFIFLTGFCMLGWNIALEWIYGD